MMKKFAVLLIVACLLLAGCMSPIPNPTGQTTTAPGSVCVPTDPTAAPTDPTVIPTDPAATLSDPTTTPTEPNPTVDPQVVAELEFFNGLFKQTSGLDERNPYFYAIGTIFSSPKELRLNQFFSGGFPDEHEITNEEWNDISKQLANPENVPGNFNRLPKAKMEAELKKYFDISLTDLSDTAFSGVFYLESTDCYGFYESGVNFGIKQGSFLDIHHNADGTISLSYKMNDRDHVITLKPNGDSYLVLSNVKAE